jgi:predicted RNase H-like nuclease
VVNGHYSDARLKTTAAELTALWSDADAVAVDIPIGLPDTPLRDAEREARKFVGERWPSVFATFPRVVLEAPSYEGAKSICRAKEWPQPSIQSYGMRRRIFEIEELAGADERVFEVHPEVSFRELVGETLPPKSTPAGVSVRRDALAGAGVQFPELPYPLEDILDAGIAAWSAARYAEGVATPMPAHHGERVGAIWR